MARNVAIAKSPLGQYGQIQFHLGWKNLYSKPCI